MKSSRLYAVDFFATVTSVLRPRAGRQQPVEEIPEFQWLELEGEATIGAGIPVLFLHGLLGKPADWKEVMERNSGGRRLLALQLPILELPPSGDLLEDLTEYTLRFLDHQGIPSAILVGNSLGGHLALRLALMAPDRVAGLGLVGSSGLFEKSISTRRATVTREFVRMAIEEIFHDPVHATDDMVEEAFSIILDRDSRRRIVSLARAAKRDNLASELHRLQCPTFMVWGKQDRITPPAAAAEFHERIPGSKLDWIDVCGHAPQIEFPERMAASLRRFLLAFEDRPRRSQERPSAQGWLGWFFGYEAGTSFWSTRN